MVVELKGSPTLDRCEYWRKLGFTSRGLAGTSAGGLVGALYAAGYSPDEMAERLGEIDQGNLFSRMHGDGPALLGMAGGG